MDIRRVRTWIAAALAALLVCTGARAAEAPAKVVMAEIAAHPALWTVHGPKGTAYLFGSIHILPPNMRWHSPKIDAAMKDADTFVFEIPMDDTTKAQVMDFVRANAILPQSQTLPGLLDDKARKDYEAVLALSHVPAARLADKRPWYALLVLELGYLMQRHLSPDAGVDREVYRDAVAEGGKEFRAFETPEQQFRLLMPADRTLEIDEFDEGLKELLHDQGSLGNLIDAWADGNAKRLGRLMNADIKSDPKVEKALFTDRNRNWTNQIAGMLDEKHTYFITVGAGHLCGPGGVPAMLRAKGFKVDGP